MLIAVKNYLQVDTVSCSEEGEILAVDISISHKKLSRMILVYNPQFTNIMNIKILKKQLEILVSKERNIILLGDFNLPKLFTTEKFDSYNNISNKQYEIFKKLLNSIQPITQCVNFATRGINILDLIFVRDKNSISSIKNLPPISNSDHSTILFSYEIDNYYKQKSGKVFFRNFNKTDFSNFKLYFKSMLSSIDYTHFNSEQLWNFYENIINNGIKMFVPQSWIYINKKCKYSPKQYHLFNRMKRLL